MSSGCLSRSPEIIELLDRCRRRVACHAFLRGIATLLIAVIAYLLAAASLDYLIGLPATVRVFLLVSFFLVCGWVGWKFMVAPLMTSVSETELGAAIDLSCPDLHEGLATLISIERPEATVGEAGSAVMRERLRDQVAARLGQIEFREVVNNGKTGKRLGTAAALILAAILPVLLWPSGSQLLMQRLVTPFANLATASNLHFDVADGNRTVARGTNVRIAAVPRWRTNSPGDRPEQVKLQLTADNGHTESLPMNFDEISGSYIAEIARIANALQYRVVGGGARTELFTVNVVDAPEIQLAVMTATPPVYTGKAVERFDGMLGEMSVFERSRMEILLEFNKPVSSATLLWVLRDQRPLNETELMNREFDNVTGEEIFEEDPMAELVAAMEPLATQVHGVLTADGTAAVFEMTADVGGDFVFEVVDEYDLINSSEPDRRIQVVYDRPPELKVSGIRDGDRFRPDDIIPVNVFVVDDIGVGELELHYRRNEDVTKIVAATDYDHGALEVTHGFRLKLTDLEGVSGNAVTLRVRAADERPEPGPQEVWSQEFTIRIDNNAKAAGARALEQETKELIDALKAMEQQLEKDAKKATELGEKAREDWDDAAREQTQRLSEKEQQQGRILEQLAGEVATHPMMQESAAKLQQLGEQIRDDVPEILDAAASQNRSDAPQQLQESANKLEDIRRELQAEIAKIEETARLEQDLAELNRLAIDAEQLARDAEQLDQDRNDPERRPEEMSEPQWQQQLEQRQQQLNAERQQLSEQLSQLLREQPELLESAQRAQREQLTELARLARELAEQQQRVATGVDEEAQQVGMETRQLAKDLEQVREEAKTLNEQMEKLDSPAAPADVDKLEAAVKDLQRGNLAAPQQNADEVAAELQTTGRELATAATDNPAINEKDPPESDPAPESPEQARQRAAAAEQSAQLADRLERISEQLQQMRDARNAAAPTDGEPDDGESSEQPAPATDPDELPRGEQQDGPVRDLLKRLDELAAAAEQASERLQAAPSTNDRTRQTAEQTAERAQRGHEEASAGRFSKSAEQLRQASDTANQTSEQLTDAGQEDQRQQTQGMSEELRRMADIVDRLQQDDASQAAAQQQSQQSIAQQAAELPQQLGDLAERLNLPELAMQQEGQQAQEAQQAANAAQQESRQASSQLQQGELQNAVESGRETETQLNRLAQLAEEAGQQPNDQPSPVPTEVGESVAEALQDLQQAAQAMQQSSEQGGEQQQSDQSSEQASQGQQGQPSPGDQAAAAEGQPSGQPSQSGQQGQNGQPSPGSQGQPGQPSGAQQLSDAAQQLAEAAQQALPEQFNPGQMSEGSPPSTAGRDAMGNVAMWDGLLPDAANGMAGSRNWGQQNEELDTETSDGVAASRDSEYQALIRMYFREVAKATAAQGSAD